MLRIGIHAGTRSPMAWKDGTDRAMEVALQTIKDGGSALDAVIEATVSMEDDERFNAGTGSRIRIDGSIQMDAAVAVPGGFGAVACIERVKNPVRVARKVMESTPHILLCGRGATEFARRCGFPDYDPKTEKEVKRRKDVLDKARKGVVKDSMSPQFWIDYAKGCSDTVGAVCCKDGEIAAALSTGGAGLMLPGRIGDTPSIGCGIYVDGEAGVVATGVGEEIMKQIVAYRVHQKALELGSQKACEWMVEVFPKDIVVGTVTVTKRDIGCAASTNMAYTLHEER
jgi:L-asparaginase/beta-aspartyl-peptidase (threonine type)